MIFHFLSSLLQLCLDSSLILKTGAHFTHSVVKVDGSIIQVFISVYCSLQTFRHKICTNTETYFLRISCFFCSSDVGRPIDFCLWSYIIFSTIPRVSPSRSDSCSTGSAHSEEGAERSTRVSNLLVPSTINSSCECLPLSSQDRLSWC